MPHLKLSVCCDIHHVLEVALVWTRSGYLDVSEGMTVTGVMLGTGVGTVCSLGAPANPQRIEGGNYCCEVCWRGTQADSLEWERGKLSWTFCCVYDIRHKQIKVIDCTCAVYIGAGCCKLQQTGRKL